MEADNCRQKRNLLNKKKYYRDIREFIKAEKEVIKQVAKHEARYNKTAKTVLNFKSPNKVV